MATYIQTLICVLVARSRRCLTLSNSVPWQNWMAAYLGYTLRMKTLFRGWPVMAHETHTRRRRLKLGVSIGSFGRIDSLLVVVVLDTDSGSLFYSPHHCSAFYGFLSISCSHVWLSHWPLFTRLSEITDADKGMNPIHLWDLGAIRQTPGSRSIRKSLFESRMTFGWRYKQNPLIYKCWCGMLRVTEYFAKSLKVTRSYSKSQPWVGYM